MKTKTLALSGVFAALALAGAGIAYAQTSPTAPSNATSTYNGSQPPAPPATAPDGAAVAASTYQQQAVPGAVNSDGNIPIVAQPSTPAPTTVYVQSQPQVVYEQTYAGYPYYGGYYGYGPGYYYGPGVSVGVGVGFGGYYHGGYYGRGGYGGRGFVGGGFRGGHR